MKSDADYLSILKAIRNQAF